MAAPTIAKGTTKRIISAAGVACAAAPTTEAVATLETLVYPVQVLPFASVDTEPPAVTVPAPADVDTAVAVAAAPVVVPMAAVAVKMAVLDAAETTVPMPDTLAVPNCLATTNGDTQSHTGRMVSRRRGM